jgi:hypothetical protein
MELIKQYKIDCRVVINTLNLSFELLLLKYELCFEALEIRLVPQNNLHIAGTGKKLQSRFLISCIECFQC